MGKAGRKFKSGKRVNGGRHSRAGVPPVTFDKGSEHTQAMQALYGQDGADAIGRAYRSGLLGEGSEAKALLDTARRISGAYWAAYATGSYQCPLGDRTHGSGGEIDHERIKRREEWLNGCLDHVRGMGDKANRAFRQLVVDVNPDNGPLWMDRLIWASRRGIDADVGDLQTMRAALDALETLAS